VIQRTLTITSERGLHARAAAKLVKLASQFESEIKLARVIGGQQVDAKSILGILLLAASQGTELRLTVEGQDEGAAAVALEQLVKDRFGEEK